MASQLPPTPSGYPLIGHAIQYTRDPFGFVESAVAECGEIYRMCLPAVDDMYVLAAPEYADQVLVTNIDSFGKTDDFRRAFGNGLLSVEGQQWRRQREILQPLFYRDRIKGYTENMVTCTRRRLETWEPRERRDMETEMRNLTLEILFSTLFGRELMPGEDQDLRDAADGLNDWFEPTSWILPPGIPTPARRRFNKSKTRLRQEVRALLDERAPQKAANGGSTESQHEHQPQPQDDDSGPIDLLSQLQRARDATEKNQLSTDEIEDQLVTMVFAGHETTAAALAFTWYLLATHPGIRDQFHSELDTVLNGEPPAHDELSELDVTERILREALRLYPPVHTIPRQTTTTVEIDGYRIPEDHDVHLSIIHIHRDDQFYDAPLEFRPDRWTEELEKSLPDFAYMPFGGGRRTCIGREFALLEAKTVLATVGQQFQFEWEGDTEPDLEPRITIRTADGLPLRAQRR